MDSMPFRRDHPGWWIVMGVAVLSTITSRTDLLDRIIGHRDWVHALIELVSIATIGGAGIAIKSPFKTSQEGRMKYMKKKENQMTAASVVATKAAVKSEQAVKITGEAADLASDAKHMAEEADE